MNAQKESLNILSGFTQAPVLAHETMCDENESRNKKMTGA